MNSSISSNRTGINLDATNGKIAVGGDAVGENKIENHVNVDLAAIGQLLDRLESAEKADEQINLMSQLLAHVIGYIRLSIEDNRRRFNDYELTLGHLLDAVEATAQHVESLDRSLAIADKMREMAALLSR